MLRLVPWATALGWLVASVGLSVAQAEGQDRVSEHKAITNTIGMKLVLIPAGEFLMGSTPSDIDKALKTNSFARKKEAAKEQPQHRVRITKPFYMGRYEVTVNEFRTFVDDTGYKTETERDGKGGTGWNEVRQDFEGRDPKYGWRNPGFPQTDEHPVLNITWHDAVAFCEWLTKKESKSYRLPTEAEWEYACRAGTNTLYQHGDDPEGLATVGNVADAAVKETLSKFERMSFITASDGYRFTSPVGKFKPNAFGLCDMHGNAVEWCADWFDDGYYQKSPTDNPQGPKTGSSRVFRGGGWGNSGWTCRSAARDADRPSNDDCYLYGFRVAMTPAKK